MDCKIVHVEQNSDDWDSLRVGRITASRIGDVMAKPDTLRYLGYQREIVLELLGYTNVEKTPEWYAHGREMEPRGLQKYSWKYKCELDRDVFLIHDDYDWLSCSPDSLVRQADQYIDGVEMKSRKQYKAYRAAIKRSKKYYVLCDMAKAVEPGYRWQLQTSMMITGFDRWFYTNYYEDNEPQSPTFGEWKLGRCAIPRDQKLIDEIECQAMLFMTECYRLADQEM